MRNISQRKNIFGIALLFGGLVGGFLAVGVSEAQKLHSLNRDIVLLDCVENANAFEVRNVSSTLDVDIHQGLDCAAAVQKLFARGFVLGPGIGGATSAGVTSLNHFLMLFVLDINSLIEPTLEKHEPLAPILQRPAPLPPPIFQIPAPLTPMIQRRNP